MLKPYADNLLSNQKALTIQNWVKSGAMVGGVVVVYIGVRLISETWAKIEEVYEDYSRWTTMYWVNRVGDRLAGKPKEEGNWW